MNLDVSSEFDFNSKSLETSLLINNITVTNSFTVKNSGGLTEEYLGVFFTVVDSNGFEEDFQAAIGSWNDTPELEFY